MTEHELIAYATRFGERASASDPRLRDDLVGAALLGLSIALASPSFPPDPGARKRFAIPNISAAVRRERAFHLSSEATFTDIDLTDAIAPESGGEAISVAALARQYRGLTRAIFLLTFGPKAHTSDEVGRLVGLTRGSVSRHLRKIRRNS